MFVITSAGVDVLSESRRHINKSYKNNKLLLWVFSLDLLAA